MNNTSQAIIPEASSRDQFLDRMVLTLVNRFDGEVDSDAFHAQLEIFLSLPYSKSVSLFLLNKANFEFDHQVSFPILAEPWSQRQFSLLVDRGVLASALNSDQGYLTCSGQNVIGEKHLLLLPLAVPEEILGVMLISMSRPAESWETGLLHLVLLQTRQLALTINNKTLTIQTEKNQVLLRQKIAGRTQHLEQSKRELKTILDSVKTGILIIDQKTNHIVNANKTALEIMGYPKEAIVGSPCQAFCLKGNETCPFSGSDLKEGLEHSESLLTKSNGESIPILKTVVPVLLGGRPCLIESFVDISEQRQLEEQFHQSQKLEAIGRLAGGVAHDFNNLLMAIMGYCDLSLTGLGKDTSPYHYVEEIGKAADRAASLTRQLLALSRRQVLQPQILDLNAVLTDIKKMLWRIIGEDIELISQLDPDLGLIKADKGQLEQVVMNLTINARDAMPEGGKLVFETSNVEIDQEYQTRHPVIMPGSYILLTVSDSGEGMDKETQTHIFEPFFTTKGVGKGTGLGLSTVYGIVKQSGGFIWVQSELGKGTTIKIFLPRTQESPEHPEKVNEPLLFPQGSETIMLIEDEALLRTSIKDGLATNGYYVLDACNGDEALLIAQRHSDPIQLVLTDVIMPGMNGREVADYLTLIHPEAKILYMSGYTDDAVIRHGLINEKTAFLQKPFTPKDLAHKVREILDLPVQTNPQIHRVSYPK
jgi:two-component system, cell cycle sensor histidine kinase and response regulator CckA